MRTIVRSERFEAIENFQNKLDIRTYVYVRADRDYYTSYFYKIEFVYMDLRKYLIM